MKAKTRRKLEMADRAFDFSCDHPDPSPGYTAAVARLRDCLTRSRELAIQQITSLQNLHAASERKHTLRRTLRRAHLAHLKRVARMASRDLPELSQRFKLERGTIPYREFRSAAGRMAFHAQSRKELLIPHGLVDTVLQSLVQSLDDFDRAERQGIEAQRMHVFASVGLDVVADEAVQLVKVLDGLNRFRFANEGGVLADWASASHVVATPRKGEIAA